MLTEIFNCRKFSATLISTRRTHVMSAGEILIMSKTLSGSELNDLVAGLHKLSRNLWWTWDQDAQDLFKQLSPRAWQNLYHNAVAVLREVSDYELRVHLQEVQFGKNARAVLTDFEKYLADKETWGHKHAAHLRKNPVAYFSAEFGFHESLPIS